ncbi:hypothetical protein F4553_003778 [Allocatelliglobosispora scoriae]|uniref:non-specific serine/threonine protein kinase n=1 Tax=Allocatelliglobosispora scoriae TaxID=643052 RepID=A0A841BTB4_9ACTN|nr:serine/threonine-protein kinase [Allocatelliglobosispora scoriae]MBB5870399.1 hypothetical protein [Allocatelliglobosispora scoriae]
MPTWSGPPNGGRTAPGTMIGGRYALRTALGHGGMGTVWRATDTVLRREVAVKEVVCPTGMSASERDSMYQRTLREARAAAALAHPSVVQVYDVVTEGERPWIVMELLDARSLADMVIEGGPLHPRAVAKIGIALLGALEVAHAAGILHRDVKPANVLITHDGRCVLTDFGVARMPSDVQLTTPGMVLGSPHFISPERAMGGPFGPPSDLFSLGVTLFTAVEGRPPFDKGDPLLTMHAVVEDQPLQPVLAGPLTEVLYGLLIKDPGRRWDVQRSRTVLRDLLAGPLAQNATAQHATDPWAVVAPREQPSWQQQDPAPLAPTAAHPQVGAGQVGGRAMVNTDAIAALTQQQAATGAPKAPRAATGGLLASVRAWPRKVRLGVGAAVAAAALVTTVAAANGVFADDPGSSPTATGPSGAASPSTAASPTVDGIVYKGKGIQVVFPTGWKRTVNNDYVQYDDPANSGRWIRLLVNNGKDAQKTLNSADSQLKKRGCESEYEKVEIRDAQLAGRPGKELEYLCTPEAKNDVEPIARHGLWRAVVVEGKVYQLYLSTTEADFTLAKPVFETVSGTYQVTA